MNTQPTTNDPSDNLDDIDMLRQVLHRVRGISPVSTTITQPAESEE